MRALVTGGGGFLGRYLVKRLLADGIEPISFSRRSHAELNDLGIEQRQGDLASFDDVDRAIQGVDAVFHVAAFPSIVMDPSPYYLTNLMGARNVVAACLKNKVRRLVYTSTQCVANTIESQEGIDESTPFAPRFLCWYQMTKAISEQLVRAANYAPWTDDYDFGGVDLSPSNFRRLNPRIHIETPPRDSTREDTLMTVALRPHLIWGPGDRHLVTRMFQRARSRRLTRVGDGKNLIATIYVENAADAHKLALDALVPGSSVPGSVYYIAQEKPMNCWQWINELLAFAHEPPVSSSVSFKTAWRMGAFLEKLYSVCRFKGEPVMTRFLATQLANSYWFDTTRAKNELGFTPRVSNEEGMRRLSAFVEECLAKEKK
ncbi:MAG: NAD-dependent epimerase/dehydratase family protein [Thermoguttaceae bacterium]|nr:NAD-dependent epimerase/dehydratase family protein [Thermoguttaceae bacterium]